MTTTNWNCDVFAERLMPYLERDVDDATRESLERHAVACAECGALLADLRKLRAEAANLPALAPSRDLWAGIAARIEAPVVPIGGAAASSPARRVAGRFARSAAIAASLVAAAGLGYVAARSEQPAPVLPVSANIPGDTARLVATVPATGDAGAAPAAPAAAATTAPAQRVATGATSTAAVPAARPDVTAPAAAAAAQLAVATLAADYDREVARLRAVIEQRRNQLDPVTVAIIEKNLQVIDAAITECKRALAADPHSRFLIESLNHSLQTKLELMRTAALLPIRT